MNVGILVISTGDRAHMLDTFLRSNEAHTQLPVVVVTQEYDTPPTSPFIHELIDLGARCGSHTPRVAALDKLGPDTFDAWVIVDDDMTLLAETDYATPGEYVARRPDIGIISCNWRRHESHLARAKIKRRLEPQTIVFTGGGMVLSARTAKLILTALPRDAQFVCDNTEWSLACYLNGRLNGRFLGSMALHNVAVSGGRRQWLHETEHQRPDSRWVRIDDLDSPKGFPFEANNMLSPNDTHLTAEARQAHRLARRRNFPTAPKGL